MNGLLLPSGEPRRLRDDQLQTIERLRASLAIGHRRPMVQAPTGYGKTVLASHLVRMAREKGRRVVFCVPAIDLIDQTLASFWQDGIGDIGVIPADHIETDWSRPVQIASVQTLMRRGYPRTDLVIIDEGHRRFDFYEQWMAHPDWQTVPFVGLSATPWTKGLAKIFDDLIIWGTTAELMQGGLVSKFLLFAS